MRIVIVLALLFSFTTVYADGIEPCPPGAKPPKVHRPPRPRPKPPVVKPPATEPCACEPGKPGKDGSTTVVVVRQAARGLALRIGVMGALYAPHGDWAWGPALQLAQPIGERGELVVDVGLALPADGLVANERGLLLHAGYARFLQSVPKLGFTLGVHSTSIDGSKDNGEVDGNYLGGTVGAVVRTGRLRAELGIVFSGLRDDHDPDTQFATGLAGSVFLSL